MQHVWKHFNSISFIVFLWGWADFGGLGANSHFTSDLFSDRNWTIATESNLNLHKCFQNSLNNGKFRQNSKTQQEFVSFSNLSSAERPFNQPMKGFCCVPLRWNSELPNPTRIQLSRDVLLQWRTSPQDNRTTTIPRMYRREAPQDQEARWRASEAEKAISLPHPPPFYRLIKCAVSPA